MESGDLFLGARVDPGTGERSDERLTLPPEHLTTHGVILGMTGSGKTGLGVILLEEALLRGVPVLALDPKGDIGNLALTFPTLAADDFEPWVDPAEARREGIEVSELATRTAERWRAGLAGWGIEPERIGTLRRKAEVTVYTPGSTAGRSLSLVGSLEAPDLDWEVHAETLRDEIEGLVSGILTLAGLGTDPVSDPEHILLANIVEHAWRAGDDLSLPDLIGLVQTPPFRKLGVFPLDDFMPEKDRRGLAMKLNALVASPSFRSWLEGEPLDVRSLMWTPDGRPRAAVIHMAHLSDTERQFVVTLLLTRMITWMRQQPGTSELRALVYMDEMFGFAPPTANPPSKKAILTIFKQARAHGVGMVVSTQNPVDLDYKAMSNAGTWMIGRLQTERDKARVLEGLDGAAVGDHGVDMDAAIGGLDKRQFVLRSTRSDEPRIFTTRWAMSFLRGTLTREEVIRLTEQSRADAAGEDGTAGKGGAEAEGGDRTADGGSESVAPDAGDAVGGTGRVAGGGAESPTQKPAADETPVAPAVPASVSVAYLDPAAPWGAEVGVVPGSARLEPALAVRVSLTFDERIAELDHRETWEAVYFPLGARFEPGAAVEVDHDPRDFRADPPAGARYVISEAPLTEASYYRDVARDIEAHLHRTEVMRLFRNQELKAHSRPGESEEAFRARCRMLAGDWADEQAAALKDRFEARIDRARDEIARAEARARELAVDVEERRRQELVSGAGKLVSMFLQGRGNARSLSGFASRRSTTRRTEERLRTASERVAQEERELDELEEELGEELHRIVAEAADMAARIDELEVGLEKDDIHVEEVRLVWVPRSAPE